MKMLLDIIRNRFSENQFYQGDRNNLPSVFDWSAENFPELNKYKGKQIIIVNTASKCGNTPQYASLQKFLEKNKENFIVLAFPCNDFGGQEPADDKIIQQFCEIKYKVTFPVYNKIQIKKNTHPLYHWLTDKSLNGWNDRSPAWNFWKYLIDKEGKLIACIPSKTNFLDFSLQKILTVS